jgi:hypothetical protein
VRLLFLAAVPLLTLQKPARAGTSCEKLAALPLPETKIVSSSVMRAGSFLPSGVDSTKPVAAVYRHVVPDHLFSAN